MTEKYGEGDKARRAMIEVDSIANVTEKVLKDLEHMLDKDEAENIKEKITTLRDSSITSRLSSSRSRLMPFRPPR
jgi:hypothetical protein